MDHSAIDRTSVTVIIITRDRHEQAVEAVHAALACEWPFGDREVVVVEETDHSQPINGPDVRYHAIPRLDKGFAYARNVAVGLARNEVLAFMDDDCRPERSWLVALVAPLIERSNVLAVGGAIRLPPSGPIGKCESILGFPGGGILYVHQSAGATVRRRTISTCNCAVRKSAMLRAGGFDENLRQGGEDEALGRALAEMGTVLYAPHARVMHAARDSLPAVLRWFIRRGRAHLAAHRSSGKPPWWAIKNSPTLRGMLLAGVLKMARMRIVPGFAIAFTLYYAAVIWRHRWARAYYPSLRTLLCIPLVKLTMDIGFDLGLLRQAVSRNRREKA